MEELLSMNMVELDMWRAIGADMGYEFDEVGHPFRCTKERPYGLDWRPMDDDADAFRLQVRYGLTLEFMPGGINVRDGAGGRIIHFEFYPKDMPDLLFLTRRALFYAAYKGINARYVARAREESPERSWD